MQKITQIDLLVHPFHNLSWNVLVSFSKESHLILSPDTRREKQAEILMHLWKERIDLVKNDKNRILIFVSNNLEKKEFERIKNGEVGASDEAILLEYAYENLGSRVFFFEHGLSKDPEQLKDKKLKDRISKKVIVSVYGIYATACCLYQADSLSEKLRIPIRQFKFLPKYCLDLRYPTQLDLMGILALPRKERKKVISERMKLYTDVMKEFRKGK